MQRFLLRSNTWLQHSPLPTYDEPATVIEYLASTPIVFYAAPAPVLECSGALYRIGREHMHHYIRNMRKKRSDEYDVMGTCFSCLTFLFFITKIPRHSNNFEFSKLPVTNPENVFSTYCDENDVNEANEINPRIILVIILPLHGCYQSSAAVLCICLFTNSIPKLGFCTKVGWIRHYDLTWKSPICVRWNCIDEQDDVFLLFKTRTCTERVLEAHLHISMPHAPEATYMVTLDPLIRVVCCVSILVEPWQK